MKKLCLASAALVALSGGLFADSINAGTSTGTSISITGTPISTFIAGSGCTTPTCNVSGVPGINSLAFWNNPSVDGTSPTLVDGHIANVGDVLAGLATGTNLIGSNLTGTPSTVTPNTAASISGSYYAMSGGTDPAATSSGTSMTPALEFSFISTQTAQTVSLLFADSGNDSGNNCSPLQAGVCTNTTGATIIGTYVMSSGAVAPEVVLDGNVGDLTSGTAKSLTGTSTGIGPGNPADLVANAGTVYGYYATVCYAVSAGVCTQSITYTTGNGNFSTGFSAGAQMLGALGWNHFALFQLASGEEVLGFTDTPFALSTNVEGQGDFNDVVLGIVGNSAVSTATPEPATIAIMGLGLAGLGILGRRRFGKK